MYNTCNHDASTINKVSVCSVDAGVEPISTPASYTCMDIVSAVFLANVQTIATLILIQLASVTTCICEL